MKKLWLDVLLAFGFVVAISFHYFTDLPPLLQVIGAKMMQVNFGLIHAYIAGRIFFGQVEWQYTHSFTPRNVGRLVLYAVIIYSYALGG